MNELSWLEIDLARLEENLAWWRRRLSQAAMVGAEPAEVGALGPRICAVVKANAYGLGAVAIAQRLVQAGVDMLAVYSTAQLEELIEAGVRRPVLVLMPTRELERTEAVRQAAVEGRIHLAVNDPEQLDLIDGLGRQLEVSLPVHLHLDTGMSRAGLSRAEFDRLLGELPMRRGVHLAGLFSHLATSQEDGAFDEEQLERFERAVQANRGRIPAGVLRHISATGGAYRGWAAGRSDPARRRRYHQDMVRLGIGLYGYGLEQMTNLPEPVDVGGLQPVVRWLGRIIHMQRYPAGSPVGYGCTYRLKRESILGVVPVGYADGYPLSLSGQATVRVLGGRGGWAAVLGRVSMDQIVIDLTDVAGVRVGDTVELLSNERGQACSLERLAELAGSSIYQILCQLSPRLPRQYLSLSKAMTPPRLSSAEVSTSRRV